jgi:hypothetical protein
MTIAPAVQHDWKALRAAADDVLIENLGTLWAFRTKVAKLFEAMLQGTKAPFKRPPIARLRLICEGEPPAKLIIHPAWNSHAKTVDLSRIECELLQEDGGIVRGERARLFSNRVDFRVEVPWPRIGGMRQTAKTDLLRALDTIRSFLDDHHAVLVRSHDHCCCCGRGLTDELSRSRGIGPECIQRIGCLAFKEVDGNSLIVPEDTSEPNASPGPDVDSDDCPFTLMS